MGGSRIDVLLWEGLTYPDKVDIVMAQNGMCKFGEIINVYCRSYGCIMTI